MQLIPSIDLRGGRCVRLLKGDFDAETRYAADPRELLRRYAASGADWLHVVDLDGARDGRLVNRALIAELCALRLLQLQVGGGLRDRASVDDLLQFGVARVVIGSAAVESREAVRGWLRELGSEQVCLAFDVVHDESAVPRLRTRGWREATQLSLWDAVEAYRGYGLRHVLCTDIDRDGALAGPNLALYREAQRRFPGIAWQASGGVSNAADLAALAALGVSSAISGKALLEGRISTEELQPFLRGA